MSRTIHRILSQIPFFQGKRVTRIARIHKGFSIDGKWKVELENGERFFVRVCDLKSAPRKRLELDQIRKIREMGVPVPAPVCFAELEREDQCVQVFEFVEGEDGEDALRRLAPLEQYELGKQAGLALKTIHSIKKESPEETWEEYRLRKHERSLREYEQLKREYIPIESALRFVEEHRHLLKDRPVVFLHDDFHPANMMFHSGKLQAVLDFDRFDWGDPWHDFYKMTLFTRNVSVPFSCGQIQGYFGGEPPEEFWKLYSLYAAMLIVPDIVWTLKFVPDHQEHMVRRLNTILDDHKNFTEYVPGWYRPF
jgi:aminoglycoside phosphotransferase (APT) family kinase protein